MNFFSNERNKWKFWLEIRHRQGFNPKNQLSSFLFVLNKFRLEICAGLVQFGCMSWLLLTEIFVLVLFYLLSFKHVLAPIQLQILITWSKSVRIVGVTNWFIMSSQIKRSNYPKIRGTRDPSQITAKKSGHPIHKNKQ